MNIKLYFKKYLLPITLISISILFSFILSLTKSDKKKIDVDPYIPNIRSMTLKNEDFRSFINSEGHLKPKVIYPLVLKVSGNIKYLSDFFTNGNIFNEGDTLLMIDSTDYSIARINAKFRLEEAKLEYLRQKAISDRNNDELALFDSKISPSDLAKNKPQLEKSIALYEAARANYKKSQNDLNETILIAPFKGRIINSKLSEGQLIDQRTNLGTIYSNSEMIIKLPLSIDDLSIFKSDFSSYEEIIDIDLFTKIGDKEINLKADFGGLSGSIDNLTQKVYLTGVIKNFSDLNLIADNNIFFNSKIYGPVYNQVYVIPNRALISKNEVLIVVEEKLYKRSIEVLDRYEDFSIVSNGLKDGERLNLTNLNYFIDGMDVRIVNQWWKKQSHGLLIIL